MSNGDPDFCVMAEYASMLTVLELANGTSRVPEKRVGLLLEARKQIKERGIPDEPGAKAAVTAVREAVLDLISRALERVASADPLGHVWITVGQMSRDWHIKHP